MTYSRGVTIAAVLFLGCASAVYGQDRRPILSYAALPAVGAPVPEFRYPLLAGDTVSTTSLRGAPAVLAMWATWCGASRAVLGEIEALAAEYQPKGVRVLILADDDPADLHDYFTAHKVRAEVAQAAGGLKPVFDFSSTATETESYRVAFALPLWLVVDAQGKVASRHGGPHVVTRISSVLDSLLTRQ